ncbi:MAG TPA: hypothetical protein VE377_20995 [Candidatus Dormibacteraeota bacterium]|nr:hypothetical protein [Candidatus Dormibacteraeota bacterium]
MSESVPTPNVPAESVPPRTNPCAPPPQDQSPMRVVVGVLALLMSILGFWMLLDVSFRATTKFPCEHDFHHGIDSPVLAVELASKKEELESAIRPACSEQVNLAKRAEQDALLARLQSQADRSLRRNTIADCFFIPLYTSFLWSFGTLFAIRGNGSRMALRHLLSVVLIVTAVADYFENCGIFRALRLNPSNAVAQQISGPSRFKWTALGIALLVVALILLRSGNAIYSLATRRLFAIGFGATGILTVVGVWRPVLIGLATTLFSLLVLLQIVALLGPFVAAWVKPTPPPYRDNFCEEKKAKASLAAHR